MPSTVGIAAVTDLAGQTVLEAVDFLLHRAGLVDDAACPVGARSPSGVNPWKREPRCTSITPSMSSSCLRLVDMVGLRSRRKLPRRGRNAFPSPATTAVQVFRSRDAPAPTTSFLPRCGATIACVALVYTLGAKHMVRSRFAATMPSRTSRDQPRPSFPLQDRNLVGVFGAVCFVAGSKAPATTANGKYDQQEG